MAVFPRGVPSYKNQRNSIPQPPIRTTSKTSTSSSITLPGWSICTSNGSHKSLQVRMDRPSRILIHMLFVFAFRIWLSLASRAAHLGCVQLEVRVAKARIMPKHLPAVAPFAPQKQDESVCVSVCLFPCFCVFLCPCGVCVCGFGGSPVWV